MTYPCGIIRDLLPLYVDDVCNEESRSAVEEHLPECEACRKCWEAMKATDDTCEKNCNPLQEMDSISSLKRFKRKISKRIIKIVCCVTIAALTCIVGYHLLFNVAIKNVPLEDVSISANVYSLEELIESEAGKTPDSDSVTISADENDSSVPVAVKIPEIGGATISITEKTLEKYKSISVISVSSDFFLRDIQKERKDDTIYISSIKTTLVNNKATVFQRNICTLEFGEINQIIFIDENGTQSVLWSR